MSDWLPIAPLGSATYQATAAAPGPTVSYTSAGGTALIAAGYVDQGTNSIAFDATHGLTSVTDTAGNIWQFSVANSQEPPAIYGSFGAGAVRKTVAFAAWCLDAAPVTSVTFSDVGGGTDTWNISLTEWSNVAWPDFGYAGGSGFSTPTGATASTRVSTPKDLVVGVLATDAGTITAAPPGTADLPGKVSTGAYSMRYALAPAVPASTFTFPPPGGNSGTTGGSSIANISPPLDLCAGDLLIMDVVAYNATVTGWPAGFTQQLTVTGAMDPLNKRFVATKIADGSETTNMTVTLSGASNASALCYSLRGAASPVPLNTATFTNGGGYTTTLGTASLTINDPSDATVYGYGGITATRGAFIGGSIPGSLSNLSQAIGGQGTLAQIGWGINVSPGASGSATAAVDVLDWAMDFGPLPTGVGGFANWPWSLSGGVQHTWVMQSFGPQGVPVQVPAAMTAF